MLSHKMIIDINLFSNARKTLVICKTMLNYKLICISCKLNWGSRGRLDWPGWPNVNKNKNKMQKKKRTKWI